MPNKWDDNRPVVSTTSYSKFFKSQQWRGYYYY